MILVACEIIQWLKRVPAITRGRFMRRAKSVTVAAVLLWQSASVLRVYPSFTASFMRPLGARKRGR
jgi:hypothetical protein